MKQKYKCPGCGTMYPSQTMADHCLKSSLCRHYNMPASDRKHAYILQAQITVCLEFFLTPMHETDLESDEINAKISNIIHKINAVFPYLNELHVNPSLYVSELNKTLLFAKKIFPEQIKVECLKLLRFSEALVAELIRDLTPFWQKNPSLKAQKYWNDIRGLLIEAIYIFQLPENYEKEEESEMDDCFDMLLEFLWPREADQPKRRQNLFLVNDRVWVVAYTRKDVREIMKREFGLVDVRMCGIPRGEVMENGMSESEMVDMAHGKCMVIGRTE